MFLIIQAGLYIGARGLTKAEESTSVSSGRVYRFIEGSLVFLFILQAASAAFAILLVKTTHALATGRVDALLAASHLILLLMLALPWLAPRQHTALPRTLLLSAIATGLGR